MPNRQFKEASFVLVGQATYLKGYTEVRNLIPPFLPVRTGWKARATDLSKFCTRVYFL
jgi:hypothetical protein